MRGGIMRKTTRKLKKKSSVHKCINGKTRPVKTILGMEERRIKKNDEGSEFNNDILQENFLNVTKYTQYNDNKK
jgi:hypothetical protein